VPLFHQQSRADLRRMYAQAWRKFRERQPMEPLEAQVAAIIAEHPEYHAIVEAGEAALEAQFPPEAGMSNPFLHMGLHLALREQVGTDRPAGIAEAHERLVQRLGSVHEAEHRMVDVLAQTLWEAQQSGRMPEERAYLERIQRL
jgi:hypothetical protein